MVPELKRRMLIGASLAMATSRGRAQAAPVRVGVLTDMTGL